MTDPSRPILVVAAMLEEFEPTLLRIEPHVDAKRVMSIVTGIGRERVIRALSDALGAFEPSHVLHVGVAGALRPGLDGVLNITRAVDASGNEIDIPAAGTGQGVTVLTLDRPALTVKDKRDLFARYNADAVDMETYHVAHLLRDKGVPMTAIRVVSDLANEAILPQALDWVEPEKGVASPIAAMRHLVTHPWHLPIVARMGWRMRGAKQLLADAVAEELDRLCRPA